MIRIVSDYIASNRDIVTKTIVTFSTAGIGHMDSLSNLIQSLSSLVSTVAGLVVAVQAFISIKEKLKKNGKTTSERRHKRDGKPRTHKKVEIEYPKDHKLGYYKKGDKHIVGVNHGEQLAAKKIAKITKEL